MYPFQYFRKHAKGFSLAEVLISVLILAEIATFTIPKILYSQQVSQYNANAKEVMGILTSAYQVYSQANTPTASTTPGDILAYINYVSIDTARTIDQSYTYGTSACAAGLNACYRLHNGGLLKGYVYANFTSATSTGYLWFLFDPDGTTDSTTNGPGKSLLMYLYFNGRLSTYSHVHNTTSDPPWFSL